MGIRVHLASVLILASVALSAQTAPAPNANDVQAPAQTLLGQGWGVDHLMVGVRDLAQSEHDYGRLGFKTWNHGQFPGGEFNSHVYFQENSFLELLSVNGSTPNKQGMTAQIANFLKRHEGAMALGIDVSSAQATADYLRARNVAVNGPHTGTVKWEEETTPGMWNWVSPTEPAAGQKGLPLPVFFVEYVATRNAEARAVGAMDHPNTAMGIHSVWFAVHDAETHLRSLRDIGLEAGESREVKFLSAHGREVKVGQGVLLILESSNNDGLLAKYLSDRVGPQGRCNCPDDDGIIGLSVEVADLGKARQMAESGTGTKLETYKGFYGTSFLLPRDVTHGMWMEMYQAGEHLQ
jgi:catechol 2,3-dioxygenase-like lactoylglutathione lyase family enzyme